MTKALLAILAMLLVPYAGMSVWVLASDRTDAAGLLWVLFLVPAFTSAGALLLWRRPRSPIGQLLLGIAIASFVIPTMLEVPTVITFGESGIQDWMWAAMWVAMTLNAVAVVLAGTLVVLLPDGHFRRPLEKGFVAVSWAVVALPTLTLISNRFVVTHSMAFPGVENVPSPLVVGALLPLGELFAAVNSTGQGLVFVGAFALQIMRYRTAPIRERKQVRWVIYAAAVAVVIGVIPYVLGELGLMQPLEHGLTAAAFSVVPILLFPAAVVVSVMEPPWVDVDIVIRKSFVYGSLSFLILLLYVGVATSLGLAAGARLDIEIAVVLTVMIAVVFQPARRWLQALADRWVFGARPTRYEAVTEFGVTIDRATDPTALLSRLVETIQKALRTKWVTARLDDGACAEIGTVTEEPALSVPIGAGDEVFGAIACGHKQQGGFEEGDVLLVSTLAGQVGLVLMNARLAGRIVNAAETERRRIERNIHDGAQQELVALVARLGMARSAAARRPLSPDEIHSLQREAQQILSDLRELAQGIHPSVLTDGGIVEAVEDRCAHLPIDVTVEAEETLRSRRFGDDVEGASYFFVTESLANVLKHAEATHARVSMHHRDGSLCLEVVDDGRGFDPRSTHRTGLSGLKDRIRALGGSVVLSSGPEAGTSIRASLPVDP